MKNLIKNIIVKIYSKLIILNLFFLSFFKNKLYFYNHSCGFGDSLDYYLSNFNKISKNKNLIPLAFGSFHTEIIKFIFKEYKKTFFQIPNFFPYYLIMSEVKKSKYFRPKLDYLLDKNGFIIGGGIRAHKKINTEMLISNILKKKKISKNIINLSKKNPYICIFVKHYNRDINDVFQNSNIRQTSDFKKIFLLIKFLKKQKINIIILGNKFDRGTIFLKKKFKNLDYLMDYEKNFADQIYIAQNSSGYIGSQGGAYIPYFFLNKKILTFDNYDHSDVRYHRKKIIYLFKKVLIKKHKYVKLHINHKKISCNKKLKIKENNFLEIKRYLGYFLKYMKKI